MWLVPDCMFDVSKSLIRTLVLQSLVYFHHVYGQGGNEEEVAHVQYEENCNIRGDKSQKQ